ncbi:hypothetical protein CDAR_184031 [Caerostris darwini]|uniref:Uncharacterized protein n=1 Tax=Caerostris darwini TaxID=1538125 RepID=A0AAV4TWP0_9ARAC|nr:hypothetical protein CDAR_184031 [Caerostris darwini]
MHLEWTLPLHLWSNSTIMITWIHRKPRELKTFVVNRVYKIQELSSCDQWHRKTQLALSLKDSFQRKCTRIISGSVVQNFFKRSSTWNVSLKSQRDKLTLTVSSRFLITL